VTVWWQDVRYAGRVLRKNWLSSLVILASLAIGVGANSAVFSVVDALLLRPLPYPQPERLAGVWLHSPSLAIFRDWPSPGQFLDLRTENHSFEQMALAQTRNATLTGRERPERIATIRTQSSLLQMLGAKPMLGRLLLPAEDQPGQPEVAILSERIWRRLFSADPAIVGKSVTIDGKSLTVAGVLQRGFLLNSEVMPSEEPMSKVDVFLPLALTAADWHSRRDENYNIVVRLKPGATVQQAQADIDIIAARIREKDKRDASFGMHIVRLQDEVVGDVRQALLVLLGAVAVVLLIACANVANLLLTRAAGREKEVAIRTALGAGWQRLARQLLTESVLLGLLGGVVGLGVARASLYVVRTMNPGNIPRLEDIGVNGAVLAFTFGVSLLTGILFGLAPVWRAVRVDPNTSLKAGGRSGHSDGGLYLRRHRLRGLLVVAELALSLVLLIGGGLLVRSFVRLQAVPPGFATEHIVTMQVAADDPKYHDDKAILRVYQDIEERVAKSPGVIAEGEVTALPLTGSVGWGGISVEGYTPPSGEELQVDLRVASADYFRAMEIPLIAGRFFGEDDTAEKPGVVIIDEKFAKRFWPRGDALGKHLWFDPKKPKTITGVVGTVKQYGLETDGKIATYFPRTQGTPTDLYLVARTGSEIAGLPAAVVSAIQSVDPNLAVYDIRSMQERLHDSLARQRFASTMLAAFAAFALMLAAIGLYGVMSYLVAQNTHDIGVLMALGAGRGDVLRLVLRQGMELGAMGIAIGLAGAAVLTRVMASLLFGVSARDAATFAVVPVLLALVAFAATAIPAWRTTRVDPVVALREE
jgi:predicted permease